MEKSEQTDAYISTLICTNKWLIFRKGGFFYLILSKYASKSHNFTSSLLY